MPYKDKAKYNEYLNIYMKRRWETRRQSAIKQLGGTCVECGTDNDLEFDHIDPTTKFKSIAKLSSASETVFQAELDKCQLLCLDCHKSKTYGMDR